MPIALRPKSFAALNVVFPTDAKLLVVGAMSFLFGGGIAVDAGRLYAATGYGNVVALDPANGKVIWEKQLEAPVRSSPTAVGDKVFVITLDGRFFCLAGADGGELWSVRVRRSRQA